MDDGVGDGRPRHAGHDLVGVTMKRSPDGMWSFRFLVDPKLRATTEMILAMPVDDRLRQLEAEANFFSSIRPIDG